MNINELDELKESNKRIIKRARFINAVSITLIIIVALLVLVILLK